MFLEILVDSDLIQVVLGSPAGPSKQLQKLRKKIALRYLRHRAVPEYILRISTIDFRRFLLDCTSEPPQGNHVDAYTGNQIIRDL